MSRVIARRCLHRLLGLSDREIPLLVLHPQGGVLHAGARIVRGESQRLFERGRRLVALAQLDERGCEIALGRQRLGQLREHAAQDRRDLRELSALHQLPRVLVGADRGDVHVGVEPHRGERGETIRVRGAPTVAEPHVAHRFEPRQLAARQRRRRGGGERRRRVLEQGAELSLQLFRRIGVLGDHVVQLARITFQVEELRLGRP